MTDLTGQRLHDSTGVDAIRAQGSWRAFAARLLRVHPTMVWTACALLLLSLPTALLMLVDERELLGVSVWVKPWKFQLSTGTFLLTLAWVMLWLTPAQRRAWSGRYVAWVAIGSSVFEVGYISWQAAWGRASHFNIGTPFDAFMYALMGVGAVLLTSTALVLGVVVLRSRPPGLSHTMRHAAGLGLVLTFVLGTVFGAYMSSQTGHAVGGSGADAGGMVLTGWSRSGGDLRVPHFFGVHAVHALLLFGCLYDWSVRRQARAGAAPARGPGAASVWVFGAAYGMLSLWSFAQALDGRPFLGWL